MTQIRGAVLPTDLAKTDKSQTWTGTQDFTGATVLGVTGPGGTSPDATTTSRGLVQLAGDLAGTAAAPTVAKLNGATPAAVATSGAYGDLTGRPALAAVATSGAYTDLTGRPALAGVATSGAYTDLTGRPALATVATSGSYTDLTNAPPTPPTVLLAYKTTNTTAQNTTTRVADPNLQFASVAVGTYMVEIEGTITTTSTGQLAGALGGTATLAGTPNGYALSSNGGTFSLTNAVATNPTTLYAGTTPTPFRLVVPLIVTAAGSVQFKWAQAASDPSIITLNVGSWMRLTKVV